MKLHEYFSTSFHNLFLFYLLHNLMKWCVGDLFVDGKVIHRPQYRFAERQNTSRRPRPRHDRRRETMQVQRSEPIATERNNAWRNALLSELLYPIRLWLCIFFDHYCSCVWICFLPKFILFSVFPLWSRLWCLLYLLLI